MQIGKAGWRNEEDGREEGEGGKLFGEETKDTMPLAIHHKSPFIYDGSVNNHPPTPQLLPPTYMYTPSTLPPPL